MGTVNLAVLNKLLCILFVLGNSRHKKTKMLEFILGPIPNSHGYLVAVPEVVQLV